MREEKERLKKQQFDQLQTGWMAPNGDFYPCGYMEHIHTADRIIEAMPDEEYSSDLDRYREGDAVRIKINPNNLNEYYVDDGHMTSGIFITVVGIALIGAGIYFLKYFRM